MTTIERRVTRVEPTPRRVATRRLLTAGMCAGPIYLLVGAAQAAMRDGFDPTTHAWSLLANGNLGWIQVSNLILAGVLTVLAAVGMHRVFAGLRGGTWGPRLVAVYGVSLIAAGLLVADPAFGFPAGTPEGPPVEASWHGIGHFVAGGVGFFALVAACFVFARHLLDGGRRRRYSAATGILLLAGFAGVASGEGSVAANLGFTGAVVLGWAWLSLVSAWTSGRPGSTTGPG